MKALAAYRLPTLLALSLALSACALGPDYQRPQLQTPAQFKQIEGWTQAQPGDALDSTKDGVGLLVRPLPAEGLQATLHEGEEDPPAGWVGWSLHQALKEPATLVRYAQSGRLPLVQTTLLLPYRGAQAPAVALKALQVTDGAGAVPAARATAVEVAGEGWRDVCYLSHAPDHATVRFAGLETDAEIAVTRSSAAGPQTLCLLGGTRLTAAGAGALPAPVLPAPVDLSENKLTATTEQPAAFTLRYGYAAGGGFIYETPATSPATTATLRLHNPLLALPYCYELVASDATGSRVVQRGTLTLAEPRAFSFDYGDVEGWSGSNARLVAGYEGTAGALRLQDDPRDDVRYVSAEHPFSLTLTPQFALSCAVRTPLADGGKGFYAKVTLRTSDGDEWSSYFARSPLAEWTPLQLSLADFRGDTREGKNLGQPLPVGRRVTSVRFTVRKGETATPVAPCLEVDAVRVRE